MDRQPDKADDSLAGRGRKPQFSLRSALILMTAACCWFGFARWKLHIAILVLSLVLPIVATVICVRAFKHGATKLTRITAILFAVLMWFNLYVQSIFPVVTTYRSVVGGPDEWLRIVYLPVIWLHDYTPLKGPLEALGERWGL